ncbi:fibronectin type III domain-containing protein [Corynebacterium pseudodiphtheriticum]|uniref:fibronectin type III domain-containing protein n=1 Tax=Corynebacterium pseudodiphtheriticum TaxID=37637 RepID=UPI00201C6C73|nr:fibronectin type III domain-containing protein [Corynebacterium pseudodiphtheriticum]UQV58169.1 fibronectin type III domain-containing protein [Corynebacterium pseudodiphtheriticum]
MKNNRRLWMQVTVAGLTSLSLGFGTLTPAHAQDFTPPPAAQEPQASTEDQDTSRAEGPKLTGVLAEGQLITAQWELAPAEFQTSYHQVQLLKVQNGKPVTSKPVVDQFVAGNATHYQFANVAPGDYVVRVFAVRGVENSQFSQSRILTTTDKPQAPEAPHKPYLQLKKGKTARVEWDRRSTGSTRIHTYVVKLQPNDGSGPLEQKVTGTSTYPDNFAEFPNLKAGVSYTATVEAQSATGNSRPSETSEPLVVSEDPNPQFTVDTDTIDLAKGGEFTVSGKGYTGPAAQEGVYLVFWAASKWTPGELPRDIEKKGVSVHIKPEEIVNGTFTKKIQINPGEISLVQGDSYQIGTLAGGKMLPIDRRLDLAKPVKLASQSLAEVQASAKNDTVTARWKLAENDKRGSSIRITLYRENDGQNTYVNHLDRGPQISTADFVGRQPGTYRVGVKANLNRDEFGTPEWTEEKFSETVTVVDPDAPQPPAAKPEGPAKPEVPAPADPAPKPSQPAPSKPAPAPAPSQDQKPSKPAKPAPSTPAKPGKQTPENKALKTPDAPRISPASAKDYSKAGLFYSLAGYEDITKVEARLVPVDDKGNQESDAYIAPSEMANGYAEFTGLKKGQRYRGQIKVITEKGETEWSAYSGIFLSETPEQGIDPDLTLFPETPLDSRKANTITVNGSGYLNGKEMDLYVLEDADIPENGIFNSDTAKKALASTTAKVTNGKFSQNLEIPANTLNPKKKYFVVSVDKHGNHEYDYGVLLKVKDGAVATPTLDVSTTTVNAATGGDITVRGAGFVGEGASQGVYVAVYKKSQWNVGKSAPVGRPVAAEWVQMRELNNGSFVKTINIPGNVLDPNEQYVIGTLAAHALSQTNRELDTAQDLVVTNGPTAPAMPEAPQAPNVPGAADAPEGPGAHPAPANPSEQPAPEAPGEQPNQTPQVTPPNATPPSAPTPPSTTTPDTITSSPWFKAIAAVGGIGLVFAGIGAALQGLRHNVPVINDFLTNLERTIQNFFGGRR